MFMFTFNCTKCVNQYSLIIDEKWRRRIIKNIVLLTQNSLNLNGSRKNTPGENELVLP